MNVEELCKEALQLPQQEKGELITRLLSDLGPSEYDVSDEEVQKRVRETESGQVSDISHDELVSGLHHVK